MSGGLLIAAGRLDATGIVLLRAKRGQESFNLIKPTTTFLIAARHRRQSLLNRPANVVTLMVRAVWQ